MTHTKTAPLKADLSTDKYTHNVWLLLFWLCGGSWLHGGGYEIRGCWWARGSLDARLETGQSPLWHLQPPLTPISPYPSLSFSHSPLSSVAHLSREYRGGKKWRSVTQISRDPTPDTWHLSCIYTIFSMRPFSCWFTQIRSAWKGLKWVWSASAPAHESFLKQSSAFDVAFN